MFGNNSTNSGSRETRAAENNISVIANIIGKGTSIVGDVETPGNIRIDGKLKGHVRCKQKLALGQGSLVDGNIYAQNAEIEGEVVGTIEVVDVLVLKPSAVINGDILTGKLVVEAGAKFNGTCKMGEQPKALEPKPELKLDVNATKTAVPKTA
ncbi:MAG: polymer-forming cytoskeletal protein [Bernardetiaceae bacterium]|jgi:cytoskeletal protein CcmA (bactofilin family)|nr:polymer-forming cytoskeletal protein [Bernardetiaceae bacterium]